MDFQDFDWGEIPFDDLPQSVKERLIASGESERQKKMDKLMRELQKEMDESSNPDELHLSDSQWAEFLSLKIDYKDDDEKELFESQGSEIPSLNTTVMDELWDWISRKAFSVLFTVGSGINVVLRLVILDFFPGASSLSKGTYLVSTYSVS